MKEQKNNIEELIIKYGKQMKVKEGTTLPKNNWLLKSLSLVCKTKAYERQNKK